MTRELILFLLVTASGFVASGVIASLFTMLSGQKEYALKPASEAQSMAAIGLTIFTGPAILTMNAIRGRHNADQPPAYLAVVLGVSAVWSYVLGLFFVTIALQIPLPF